MTKKQIIESIVALVLVPAPPKSEQGAVRWLVNQDLHDVSDSLITDFMNYDRSQYPTKVRCVDLDQVMTRDEVFQRYADEGVCPYGVNYETLRGDAVPDRSLEFRNRTSLYNARKRVKTAKQLVDAVLAERRRNVIASIGPNFEALLDEAKNLARL